MVMSSKRGAKLALEVFPLTFCDTTDLHMNICSTRGVSEGLQHHIQLLRCVALLGLLEIQVSDKLLVDKNQKNVSA